MLTDERWPGRTSSSMTVMQCGGGGIAGLTETRKRRCEKPVALPTTSPPLPPDEVVVVDVEAIPAKAHVAAHSDSDTSGVFNGESRCCRW